MRPFRSFNVEVNPGGAHEILQSLFDLTSLIPQSLSQSQGPWSALKMDFQRFILTVKTRLLRFIGNVILPIYLRLSGRPTYQPVFSIKIPSTVSSHRGKIPLHFYAPEDYFQTRQKTTFPTVINFHGGGFCIGCAAHDAKWCQVLVRDLGALVVSVDYRLAPEHPFPVAVEDGVDALLYVIEHADELGIDVDRIATSGFSAGGNLAVTVPLMFKGIAKTKALKADISAIAAWYPGVDYSRSRTERISTMIRPDKQLPPGITKIFDDSYIYPANLDRRNPYLSPFVADSHVLDGLPKSIILYTCEWDMLEKEGTEFAKKLEDMGKNVRAKMIQGVPHGWDKSPKANPSPEPYYKEVAMLLRRAFEGEDISN